MPKLSLLKIEWVSPATASSVTLPWFSAEKESEKDGSKKEDKKAKPKSAIVFAGKKSKEVEELAARVEKSGHFGGKKGETSFLRYYPHLKAENVVLLGAGPAKKLTPEILRQVGASLSGLQRREKLDWVSLVPEGLVEALGKKEGEYGLQAFCEGYLLAGYEFNELKSKKDDSTVVQGLQLEGKGGSYKEAVQHAQVLAESVCFARGLGDRPGNYLTPTILSELVEEMAKENKMKCTVLGASEIQKEKMGLLWGVAKGSEEEPKFIIVEYRGGNKSDKPIALVGKGITFDSGGISLKPPAKMEDMKYDMMGAAAVAGIMRAIGILKPDINVVAIIPTCENLPDGKAQKPGDVMKSRSGKTVEIINTDAEGRLILADALEYVQDKFEPQAIFDFATLTGAVIDALGTVTSGVMGTHQGLVDRVKAASEVTGERVWQLPLYEEYEEDLKSHVADIKNSGIREAGSSKGGTFLKFFVDKRFPWVHCDIAGTSYHRKDVNYHPNKYGAGVMVRLMTQLLLDWKPIK